MVTESGIEPQYLCCRQKKGAKKEKLFGVMTIFVFGGVGGHNGDNEEGRRAREGRRGRGAEGEEEKGKFMTNSCGISRLIPYNYVNLTPYLLTQKIHNIIVQACIHENAPTTSIPAVRAQGTMMQCLRLPFDAT